MSYFSEPMSNLMMLEGVSSDWMNVDKCDVLKHMAVSIALNFPEEPIILPVFSMFGKFFALFPPDFCNPKFIPQFSFDMCEKKIDFLKDFSENYVMIKKVNYSKKTQEK